VLAHCRHAVVNIPVKGCFIMTTYVAKVKIVVTSGMKKLTISINACVICLKDLNINFHRYIARNRMKHTRPFHTQDSSSSLFCASVLRIFGSHPNNLTILSIPTVSLTACTRPSVYMIVRKGSSNKEICCNGAYLFESCAVDLPRDFGEVSRHWHERKNAEKS